MKLYLNCLFVLIGLWVFSNTTIASSRIISAGNFDIVQRLIAQDKDPKHTLLALDDDDTLTMMPCPSQKNCQYLGDPAWFDWQNSLPENDPNRVAKNMDQLIRINEILFTLDRMPLTQANIPHVLSYAGKKGVHIIVETARDYGSMNATERQLSQDHILKFFQRYGLQSMSGQDSFGGEYLPPKTVGVPSPRWIAYSDGILYVAGLNKGDMLKDLLEKTHQTQHIKTIIFLDDTFKNVSDVAHAFAKDPNVRVISIYYTKLKAHKEALTKGKNAKYYQTIATKQWQHIQADLKKLLPGFSE